MLYHSRNAVAEEIQKKYNMGITFGSDSHFMNEIKDFYEYCNEINFRHSLASDYFNKMKLLGGLGQKHLIYGLKGSFEK